MPADTPSVPHDPYASLRIKDFRLFVAARFFLTVATQMQGVLVGWQIYRLTKDALALGMIGLAEAIPFMMVTLYAGHLADIFSRKKIILLAVTGFLLCSVLLLMFTLYPSAWLGTLGTLPIYVVIGLTGVARGFAGPSFSALLAQLVPRALYAPAAAWNSTVWQTAAVTGPAVGGLLYGFLESGYQSSGIAAATARAYAVSYGVVAALIGVSLLGILLIANRPLPLSDRKESLRERLATGIRFVFRNQVVLGALSLDLFAVFFGGAVALLPIFAEEVLRVGPEGLGLLRAAPSLGAVLTALFLAHRPPMARAGRKLLIYVAGFGVSMVVFALSTNFYLSLFVLVVSGALDAVSVVIRSTILQLMTPDEMRGRVSAVNSLFIGSSNEIGSFESGLAARLLGLVPSVIFGGSMTLLAVGITAKVAPKLRELDLKAIA
ncbi:MAG: MFS transporter [Ferruginibacter sp.]|nr:MFS transporter [Cytophagales bacterium]